MNFLERNYDRYDRFTKRHQEYLSFNLINPKCIEINQSTNAGRPPKSFNESSERSKRRKEASVIAHSSPNTLYSVSKKTIFDNKIQSQPPVIITHLKNSMIVQPKKYNFRDSVSFHCKNCLKPI